MPQTPQEFIDGLFRWIITVNITISYALFTLIHLSADESTTAILGPWQSIFGLVDNLELE